MTWKKLLLAMGICLCLVGYADAQGSAAAPPIDESAKIEPGSTPLTPNNSDLTYAIDNITLFISAVLVLFMQAGFAMLECGLNAAKNTTNILFKNLMDLAVGVLLFYAIGYGLMYPGEDYAGKYFGFGGVGISEEAPSIGDPGKLHPQVDFLFQVAFAATAATIVSGAVAGRMKFEAYLIYSAVITAFIYPVSGMWKWGGGWLHALGFYDFAGSVVVHAVGGFAGLAGAIVLGPRIGRYVNGKSIPMPGHNLAFATLGVMILWVGWYGFNPGSQLKFSTGSDVSTVMAIATNTTLAAAAGCVISMLVAWILFRKPDLTMAINGALAGLVGITANCDGVANWEALVIGAVAGVLVVAAIIVLDKMHIDDPVGAFPVHGVCGVWGGIATGIFADHNFQIQLLGSVVIPIWAFSTALILFLILKAVGLLRVSPEEEQAGLDISEHGMHAYPPHLVTDAHYVSSKESMGTPIRS